MNTSVEGIIVNNCQYAPIYLIQDPGATQANTYVLTSSNVEPSKPVSNNLKTFYENSGNIENGLINTDTGVRPNMLKKKEGVLIGNNLKLASFLLPKHDNVHKQYVVDNIVLKPNITTATTNPVPVNHHPVNTVPKIDIDRKIVKLKEVPIMNRHRPEKLLPKIKPKENTPSPTQSKHTSVQLIKLGETYHSLNHLSNEQIKMVNQALKMFNDPDKTAPEPTYDPVTNTKYIYKIVSPKDLTVVAKKKIILKDKKNHTRIPKRVEEKNLKPVIPKEVPLPEVIEEEVEPPAEAKVTRSGRKVKLPKQIVPQDSPHKTKKKSGTIVTCFQCSADFGSLYRLQKHYENHPTHIPAKIHSNLFHCLLAIIKSGSDGNTTNIFIQQLEQLIVKLKSLLPCLLKKVDGTEGQPCTINEDIGRLFGMNPGKYNIDVDALNCVKDKNGYCIHNPPKINKEQNKPAQHLQKHVDAANSDNETENCARINSVAKWPTVSKRIWKLKQKTHEQTAKKMRLKSEGDTLIELGTEELCLVGNEGDNNVNTAGIISENNINTADITMQSPKDDVSKLLEDPHDLKPTDLPTDTITMNELGKPKQNYVQFHSAHFDIRSSPIKTSSTTTVFRKFQINPSKMSNYDMPVLRSLDMVNKAHDKGVPGPNSDNNLHVSIPNCEDNIHAQNIDSRLHVSMPNRVNRHVTIPNTNNGLHVSMPNSLHDSLQNSDSGQHRTIAHSNNGLSVSMPNSNNSLHASLVNSDNRLHVSTHNSDKRLDATMLCSSNKLQVTKPNNGLHVSIANSENTLHASMPNMDNAVHVTIPNSNNSLHVNSERLHVAMSSTDNGLHVSMPNSDNGLHLTLPSSNESLHLSVPNSNDSLHDLFKDDVDLSCKDSDVIDPDLKDWIISTSEKSESSLIESALLHVRDSEDKSLGKNVNHSNDLPSLDPSDNRLLSSQGESVLNFLDTLGNDLYPETEIRGNGVDFQLDLFTFHNS